MYRPPKAYRTIRTHGLRLVCRQFTALAGTQELMLYLTRGISRCRNAKAPDRASQTPLPVREGLGEGFSNANLPGLFYTAGGS